jgi:hypothetical protein
MPLPHGDQLGAQHPEQGEDQQMMGDREGEIQHGGSLERQLSGDYTSARRRRYPQTSKPSSLLRTLAGEGRHRGLGDASGGHHADARLPIAVRNVPR